MIHQWDRPGSLSNTVCETRIRTALKQGDTKRLFSFRVLGNKYL